MSGASDFLIGKPVDHAPDHPNLRSGAQFKESLRDGRRVIVDGREVDDVTAEPTLARGIDTLAGLFDAQLDAKHAEVTTSIAAVQSSGIESTKRLSMTMPAFGTSRRTGPPAARQPSSSPDSRTSMSSSERPK